MFKGLLGAGVLLAVLFGSALARAQSSGPDILVEDFEKTNYGALTVTGTAFGTGPAHGALPNQMPVAGFTGNGLVNSYAGGDGSTGTLTSPPFKVQRKYLQFLIGGGGWEDKTCINLLLGGKIVRTATGPNTQSGGSEQLQSGQWDLSDLVGKEVVLQIVDKATGGWGHINIDQIVQSDQRSPAPILQFNVSRTIRAGKHFLNFPVKNGAPMRRISLQVDGKALRDFDIELAPDNPDWWAFLDASPFLGKEATITVNRLEETSKGLSSIDCSDAIKGGTDIYREPLRPQFHFTSRRGWLNDPNGLVFYEGEYHLFYQHNPYGWAWGNMHWGHAVSRDLVHWQELDVALYPDEHGTMFSGSAVVDWNNTAGFQAGKEPALVAIFTAAGHPFTQCLAFSNDRGKTWQKYDKNPVLDHLIAENRDPKVVWYAPENKWVMALYLDHNAFALFSSPDLKHWQKLSDFTLAGDAECPNFFQIPLDGNPQEKRWVFFGANGVYVMGDFDGKTFALQTSPRHLHNGNCWYASQVYSDIPTADGRCILVPWGRLPDGGLFKGLTFNQMMGLPVALTLRTSSDGPILNVDPIAELASLRRRAHVIKPQPIKPGDNPLADLHGDLVEIEADLAVGDASQIQLELRGVVLEIDVTRQKLKCLGNEAAIPIRDGKISLHVFVDRASLDIFGADSRLYMPMAHAFSPENHSLKLACQGGEARIVSLKAYELESAWQTKPTLSQEP